MIMHMPLFHDPIVRQRRQRGVTLLVVMVLLIGISLISIASVNTSVMELRMARNVESTINNYQTALAAIDYVIADSSNLPPLGPLNLPTTVTLTGAPFNTSTGDLLAATAMLIEDCAAPPRMVAASSMRAYSAFRFEITADLDKNASGMGQSGIVQGYLQLGPKC